MVVVVPTYQHYEDQVTCQVVREARGLPVPLEDLESPWEGPAFQEGETLVELLLVVETQMWQVEDLSGKAKVGILVAGVASLLASEMV